MVLKNSLFEVKNAMMYLVNSVISTSTNDLGACPILEIVENGDESTGYLVGSDAAVFTMAHVILSEVTFATSIIAKIYSIDYGNVTAEDMVTTEYGELLSTMQATLNEKIEKWAGRPKDHLLQNAKIIYNQNKGKNLSEISEAFTNTYTDLFP